MPQGSRRTNEYRLIQQNYTTIVDHLSSKEVLSRVVMKAFKMTLISDISSLTDQVNCQICSS